jgi:tetratricopeptide (TPR) repeat protein
MNLAIRGIEADFGPEHADTFRRDLHPDLRADYVLANPPFNDSDAATYCTEAWVPFLCGGGPTGAAALGASAIMQVVGTVVGDLSAARSELLDEIREHLRCGREAEAARRLTELRSSPSWLHLPAEVKGRALRLMSSAALATNRDLNRAEACVAEARREEPAGDFQTIDALLVYFREGAQPALAKLGVPATANAWNLQLALLLAEGRSTEVIAATDTPSFGADAETHRVRALALLLEKRVEKALAEIAKSTALNPEWSMVRLAEATILYSSCICPSFSGWGHLNWPVPPDRSLVKQDVVSLGNLHTAAEKFDRLLDEETAGGEDHAGLETWKLACLANEDGQQAAAAAFARQVLDASPENFRVVMWALERGYSFDVDRVRTALQAVVAASKPPVDAILALANLHALRGDVAEAEAVLNTNRSYFADPSAETVWQFMMTQLAGARNAGDEARALLANVSDTNFRRRAEAMLLRQTALRTGEIKPLADLLERNYHVSGDPLELLECCEAKIDAADPKFVADHAEMLLRELPTARALQVSLVGAGRAGQATLGLALLDSYAGLLGDGPLPAPFWRMRIDFLSQLGRLPDAVQEAERLASHHTDARNLLAQFSAQFALGDLRGCVSTARLISGRPDVPPLQRLQVAAHIGSHDQPLAVSLWEEAVKQNSIDPEVIMLAVDLGFRLGLDDRVGPLLAHLPRLAASGEAGVRMIGMEEILQHMRDHDERLREVNEHYNAGRLPMHMCAAEARHPLADVYHLQLERNEQAETLLGRAPLLARHGAKPVNCELTLNSGKTYADITAILLAAHFDILELIERELGPVRISARLPQSLIAQLHQIENGQPSLQPGKQALVDLAAQNKVKGVAAPIPLPQRQDEVGTQMGARWCAWLERIREAGGFLVDYLPLKSNDTNMTFVTLSEGEREHVIGVGELLSALVRAGVITPEERQGCTSAFGIEATAEGRAIELAPDTPIFLESGIAEQFGRAGILPALCKNRRVEIDEAVLIRVREELRADEQRKRLAEWLRRLLDRIQRGLRDGSYVAFASNLPRTSEAAFLDRDEFGTFQDMFDPRAADGGAVWCDDRFLNGFNDCEAGSLIGISEVLLALRLRGALDEPAYYALILRLRAANVRYLPLSSDELLHHLRRAPIDRGRVVETAALSVLRRSLAVALLDQQRLQKPHPEQAAAGHLSELAWIQSVHVAVTAGIAQLWREDSLSGAESRTDWLLEFVHFHTRLVSEAIMENSPGNPALSMASDLAQLFIAGFGLPSESPLNPNAPSSRRARYFGWLDGVLLAQHAVANPEILPVIGDVLTNTLADPVWMEFEEGGQRKAAQLYLYGIAVELPQALRPYFQLPAEVLTELKATVRPLVVHAFGRSFDHPTWWEAAAAAFNGQATKLRDADDDEFTLKPAAGEAAAEYLLAEGPDVVEGAHVHEPLFGLLAHSADERRSFLQKRPELFDCPGCRRAEAIELLVNMAEPGARMVAAADWRTRSTEWFYRRLATRLRGEEDMEVSDFLPDSADGLRDHLRLVITAEPQWNETAQQLVSDEGCMSALKRVASLPVVLPTAIVTAVRALNVEDREELFTRVEATLLTPVSRFHLVHLLAACADLNTGYLERAKVLLGGVLGEEGIKSWPAFHALLKWTFLQLRQLPVTDSWSAAERISLAWVHAARLHNELLAIHADSAVIESRFNAAHLFLARNPILPEASLHDDVCRHPPAREQGHHHRRPGDRRLHRRRIAQAGHQHPERPFLAEVRGLHKNVAAELLEKLLKDELKVRSKRNLVQSQVFSEKLKKTLNAYHNRAISTMQVIEELIKLAKDLDAATKRGEDLGLTDDEIAFYDALAANDSAVQAMGDDKAQGDRRRADHPGEEERDHRLDPPRKRPGQDQGDGEAHPEQTRLPAGPAGRGGEDRARAGGAAVCGVGVGPRPGNRCPWR